MKVQPIHRPDTDQRSWLVLDDDYRPIAPIQAFLTFREQIGLSPHTVRAGAHHLKLYWEYLRDAHLDWAAVDVAHLAAFVPWLRQPRRHVTSEEQPSIQRTDATIDQILTAVHAFYDFHMRMKTVPDLALYHFLHLPRRRYKGFLSGIARDAPIRQRLVRVTRERRRPKTLTANQVEEFAAGCRHARDAFLVRLLYETGMRIGQALGLRHEDISVESGEIRIIPRADNVNGARAKTNEAYLVFPSPALLHLYVRYLVEELDGLAADHLPDYVFINLWDGAIGHPMGYPAVLSLFKRLSRRLSARTGTPVSVTPHMLRHTRATEWIRDDHLPVTTVSRLLGHKSTQTTSDTYLHLTADDLRGAVEQARAGKEGGDGR